MKKEYTVERENYFRDILNEIAYQEAFGKRNPVDVGMDCGYSEEDIIELLQWLWINEGKGREVRKDLGKPEPWNFFKKIAILQGNMIKEKEKMTFYNKPITNIANVKCNGSLAFYNCKINCESPMNTPINTRETATLIFGNCTIKKSDVVFF